MDGKVRNALILSAVLASALRAGEARVKITVMVYNYAAVSPDVLAQSEREAGRIYVNAGVAIKWLDCPLSRESGSLFPGCDVQTGPAKLVVRLLPQALASRLSSKKHAHGFAMMTADGSFARFANVFTDETYQLAEQFDRHSGANLESGTLLGVVIAHELGHLLVGSDSHSDIGIMRAEWYWEDLKVIAQHTIAFTPAEVARMRANVQTRMAAEAAMPINASGTSASSLRR